MSKNRWNMPDLGFGLGLRTVHYSHILSERPPIDWFEIISENYMDTGGRPLHILEQIVERYPVVMHGVSLSIGSTDPIDKDYLKRLKALAERIDAPWLSDHLCWTGVGGKNTHDLLPMPYTEEALKHTIERTRMVSDILERPLILENPSSYVEFSSSTMPEWEFMARLAEDADCGILLDVNNIYVSSFNHNFDPKVYIDAIPAERVCQYHLAGHTNNGTHIIDTHDDYVIDEVWELFKYTIARIGSRATMVEWDDNIPEFEVVYQEVMKAKAFKEEIEQVAKLEVAEVVASYGD